MAGGPKFRPILRWLVGNVCTHTQCFTCEMELSRKHGVMCSGVEEEIKTKLPEVAANFSELPENRATIIDYILNKQKQNQNIELYKAIARWIQTIQKECYGMNIQPIEENTIEWQIVKEEINRSINQENLETNTATVTNTETEPERIEQTKDPPTQQRANSSKRKRTTDLDRQANKKRFLELFKRRNN